VILLHFARKEMEEEFFINLIAPTRQLILNLALFSKESGLPKPVVTGLSRTREWYEQRHLPPLPFSWHYRVPDPAFTNPETKEVRWFTCAADLRIIHYKDDQLGTVTEWLKLRCPDSRWEVITKLHGTGPHIHVAFKDYRLRRLYEANNNKER